MSVPVNERTHGKFEAVTKAFELSVYTLKITKNEKIFTKDFQEALTDKIVSAALDIFLSAKHANEIFVKTENDRGNFIDRHNLQKYALQRCADLSALIMLSKPIFHLSSKRVKYWAGMTKETKDLISAWIDSDMKRFAPLFK